MSRDDSFQRGDPPAWPPRNSYGRRGPRQPGVLQPLFMVFVVCAGLALAAYYWRSFNGGFPDDRGLYSHPREVTPSNGLYTDEKLVIDLYNKSKASVVHITSLSVRRAVGFGMQEVPEGTGSGSVQVTLFDNTTPTTYPAAVVGVVPDKDLAVLRIGASKDKLHPIPIGESDKLQVGQYVFAIGNPYGLDQTLTRGIVSAIGREITSVTDVPIKNVIQTDAAINPGNSGGPLLDSSGRLVGVTTAIYSRSGASAGIGFAIPVDEVNRVVPQLIESGKVTRPVIGVEVFSDQQTHSAGLSGALIKDVRPGSPALQAGLRPTTRDPDTGAISLGDLIVAVDGQPVKRRGDLYSLLGSHKVGDVVKVTVVRDQEKVVVDVTLAAAQ
jgi:S1-C subfamily serine protease